MCAEASFLSLMVSGLIQQVLVTMAWGEWRLKGMQCICGGKGRCARTPTHHVFSVQAA